MIDQAIPWMRNACEARDSMVHNHEYNHYIRDWHGIAHGLQGFSSPMKDQARPTETSSSDEQREQSLTPNLNELATLRRHKDETVPLPVQLKLPMDCIIRV